VQGEEIAECEGMRRQFYKTIGRNNGMAKAACLLGGGNVGSAAMTEEHPLDVSADREILYRDGIVGRALSRVTGSNGCART
jgi:hypothetical protein